MVALALVAWRAEYLKVSQIVGPSPLDGVFVVNLKVTKGSFATTVHAAVVLILAELTLQII